MTTKRSTPNTRARKETVAEEPDEATTEPQETEGEGSGVPAEPAPSPDRSAVEPTNGVRAGVVTPDQLSPDKGMCDNHPDRPAILHVTRALMPWLVNDQRFCNRCVPASYRYLM